MTAKHKMAAKIRTPAMAFESRPKSPLFRESDIPQLARAAELPLKSADHGLLATKLTLAFFKAHGAEYMRNEPPTAELHDGYAGAAAAGRNFLLALGIEADPARLVSESYSDILDRSGVLRALDLWGPPDMCHLLHREVVDALPPQYPMSPTQKRDYAATRLFVEAARGTGYLIAAAEAAGTALPKPTRHGPSKAAFARVLLDELVQCYYCMFACLPIVKRTDGETRSGPALKWLRHHNLVHYAVCKSTPL